MLKKVFISYNWGNSEHQEWVVNLATRLMNDTVDVILDKWSLKDGQDTYSFMEEMVKSPEIFRVLIISDAKYAEKADNREGGVGTETQIITPSIYSHQKQEKFVPVVLERDENGNPSLPIYLKHNKYIDFSRIENHEDSYEELLRNILEAPSIPKPKLGTKPPLYITEMTVNLSETNNKLRTIENQLKRGGSISIKELNNFLDLFLELLWTFELKNVSNDIKLYGEQLFNSLKSYKPLREDYIKFIDILSSQNDENSHEIIIDFFENAPLYERPKEDTGGWIPANFEIFQIIFHELFIYNIAICIKNKNYKLISDLLHSKYYKKYNYRRKNEPDSFVFLYNHNKYLETYCSQVYNKATGLGDYIITNLSDSLKREDVILADTLCYFVSSLGNKTTSNPWFPVTYLYGKEREMIFFEKISSKNHFERIKIVFNIDNKQELEEILNASIENSIKRISYNRFNSIPFIHELVKPETIAIYR